MSFDYAEVQHLLENFSNNIRFMKRVAIVGIQGVPAKYGGFETLVENIIGDNCSPEVCYTVLQW